MTKDIAIILVIIMLLFVLLSIIYTRHEQEKEKVRIATYIFCNKYFADDIDFIITCIKE